MRGDKKTKRKKIENLIGYFGLFLFYIGIPYGVAHFCLSSVKIELYGIPQVDAYIHDVRLRTALVASYLSPIVYGLFIGLIYFISKKHQESKEK